MIPFHYPIIIHEAYAIKYSIDEIFLSFFLVKNVHCSPRSSWPIEKQQIVYCIVYTPVRQLIFGSEAKPQQLVVPHWCSNMHFKASTILAVSIALQTSWNSLVLESWKQKWYFIPIFVRIHGKWSSWLNRNENSIVESAN